MMKKIRQGQDSWFAKLILILTALSFMSLFGISGYIGNAGKNKPVIEVDGNEVLHGDFMSEAEGQVAKLKNSLGDKYNDNMRAMVLQEMIEKKLSELIIARTAKKLGVSISDKQIQKVIFSQESFFGETGKFDLNIMKRMLLLNGLSEKQYIQTVKEELIKSHLLSAPIENINTPDVMAKYLARAENQRKIFDYIKIDTKNIKIDREISNDELGQYYQDFIANFTNPETRDVNFIFISNEEIEKNIKIDDEQINSFYNENITQFETPQTREILQIITDTEDKAINAQNELKQGKDFYLVAQKITGQSKADTNIGFVDENMLLDDVSQIAFKINKNEVSAPIKSELGWHIIKVENIKQGTKTPMNIAKATISKELAQNQTYEEIQKLIKEIDTKVGLGEDFAKISKDLDAKIEKISNLDETGVARSISAHKQLTKNMAFIESIFSYNENEVSQVLETDDGIALLSITKINPAYTKDISLVKNEIEKIWAENEKIAITQEIIDDVMNDLENGDNISDVAKRFKLNVATTKPLTRKETFENISASAMLKLFQEEASKPKVIDMDKIKIIAISKKAQNNDNKVSDEDARKEKMYLSLKLVKEYSSNLIADFAKDYDVKIRYDNLGLQ